jgi:predicted kinase
MIHAKRRPMLVIVSGRPGSGKSTLARKVADAMLCPVISRDEINTGINLTYGHDPELVDKDQAAKASFDIFFTTIERLLLADVTLVAEAAFQDYRWRIGLEPVIPVAKLRIIQCSIDPGRAYQRLVRRRAEQHETLQRRPPDSAPLAGPKPSAIRPFVPLSLPVPSLSVTTEDGYDPGLDTILAFLAQQPRLA